MLGVNARTTARANKGRRSQNMGLLKPWHVVAEEMHRWSVNQHKAEVVLRIVSRADHLNREAVSPDGGEDVNAAGLH